MGILSDMLVNWGFRDPALVDGDIAPEQLNEPKVIGVSQRDISFADNQKRLIESAKLDPVSEGLLNLVLSSFPLETWVAESPEGGIVVQFKGVVKNKETNEQVFLMGLIGNDIRGKHPVFVPTYYPEGREWSRNPAVIMVANQGGAVGLTSYGFRIDDKFKIGENFMAILENGIKKIITDPKADYTEPTWVKHTQDIKKKIDDAQETLRRGLERINQGY